MSNAEARLLVVDDIEDNRYALTRRLAREGYRSVATAVDGRQALQLLAAEPFDLVLLDIMMPNMNGYEVLEQMKADDGLRHVPVIMISAIDELDSVVRCIELGAEDYLFKPFNPILLRARVGASLERKRLHDEVMARTRELSESLEQQTATSEVLQVIASSSGTLKPVFQAILESATRICEAKFGNLVLFDGSVLRMAATHGAPQAFEESFQRDPVIRGKAPLLSVAETKQMLHVADLAAEERFSGTRIIELAGARTFLGVPMLKDDGLVGAIAIYRQEVRPFSDKQIELVTSFASQAVIAIENTRLLNELREALEQQTATSEVLQVISSSPGELEHVFQAMLENAVRICEAGFGTLFRCDGERMDRAASVGTPPALVEFQKQRGPFRPEPDEGLLGRVFHTREVAHTVDYAAEAYASPPARLGGARSTVAVPMLKDDALVGAIVIYRQEIRPFSEKQIELVKNFAAQAVIAIENTRLLNELREFAAAADRHRRRAQGDQPLGLRSAGGARHADGVGGLALRGRSGRHPPAHRRRLSGRCNIRLLAATTAPSRAILLAAGSRIGLRANGRRGPYGAHSRRCRRSRIRTP